MNNNFDKILNEKLNNKSNKDIGEILYGLSKIFKIKANNNNINNKIFIDLKGKDEYITKDLFNTVYYLYTHDAKETADKIIDSL